MPRFGDNTLRKFSDHLNNRTLDEFPDPFIQANSANKIGRRDALRRTTDEFVRKNGEIPISNSTLEALGYLGAAS